MHLFMYLEALRSVGGSFRKCFTAAGTFCIVENSSVKNVQKPKYTAFVKNQLNQELFVGYCHHTGFASHGVVEPKI